MERAWRGVRIRARLRVNMQRTILAWTLAWGATGIALYLSGVFNLPRTGPLWLALLGGAIAWAIAGAYTFRLSPSEQPGRRVPGVALIWALAYLVSFTLAGVVGTRLENTLGGFFYMLFGWALGGGLGAFASTRLLTDRARWKRSSLLGFIWLLAFLAGSYVALFGLYLGPEMGKITIGAVIGQPAALTLGAGLGMALGGLVASAIAAVLTRWVP